MTDDNDQIPIEGEWRGVGLHAGQTEERLRVVRSDIDAAHELRELEDMAEFAQDVGRAPEARVFARMKALATLEDVAERRGPRSRTAVLDRQFINALARGLTCQTWQDPRAYASLLDPPTVPRSQDRRVRREVPLPDKWK